MIRTVFAMAVAALLFTAASATSQAAPIAPLSGASTASTSQVTHVRWWYHHHRHCWVGRYGRVHCG